MDNLDDSENNAKISDSAYSNSCSNSQSRRSHSSKSTHSGSHSSGSSGYGGKPSTSGSSTQPPEKRIKDPKKKKQVQADALAVQVQAEEECQPEAVTTFETPQERPHDVDQTPTPQPVEPDEGTETMEFVAIDRNSAKEEVVSCSLPLVSSVNFVTSRPMSTYCSEGFSCVISMHDGVVMYTTSSLTTTLGFPKEMWIGRSFIDFVHPRDRSKFASQITTGLAVPKIANGTQEKGTSVQSPSNTISTMVCRIRRYRGLNTGFAVKERVVTFMPFLLKLTFKNVSEEESKDIYLVIQATPFFSAFKTPNEIVTKAVPFVLRHAANGNIEYIDPESVSYLGYLPQDVTDKDALQLYHPEDLGYLRQVYETIVKEGGMPRSKPYRMMTQNGDFIKLETEWSSFINPWSKKLEFVVGKHYIIEGPSNPDVFQTPDADKVLKLNEEEKNKAQTLREAIIRILNEVLTKPAETAKQQMSKRCQDLAIFMESLMEEQPKTNDEFAIEAQEADHSYYERDSVMLGGISPHHEYNDSKSSTETPLSYNQLNYNETLQRYFDSHQPFYYEDNTTVYGENILGLKELKPAVSCLSPMAQNSGDSGELTSSCESALAISGNSPMPSLGDYQPVRLTEALLSKHNAEMEKELLKFHRESRSLKCEREKASNETRKKKKEHLARCNASFQPTSAGTMAEPVNPQLHGVKRSKQVDSDQRAHKHRCSSPRNMRRWQTTSSTTVLPPSTTSTTTVATNWPPNNVNNMNTFILGMGIPQQMTIMSPMVPQHMAAVAGMFPMYYAPTATATPIPTSSTNPEATNNAGQFHGQAMQCMMYGQAMYGSPFMYSPIGAQMSYPMQQGVMAQSIQQSNTLNTLGLDTSNYEKACKPSPLLKPSRVGKWREKKRAESHDGSIKSGQGNSGSLASTKALNRSTEAVQGICTTRLGKSKNNRMVTSDETKTDGESSYSSFYSSFFKTESGSAEESVDAKRAATNKVRFWDQNQCGSKEKEPSGFLESPQVKKVVKRKMEPPWLEQVCATSELIYKYQVLTKTMDEVLKSDKQKITSIEQPSLVNEQLGQLYLDLQLEGVAARLTLEEGITSSSSSGEETAANAAKKQVSRRKREYSKLVMIYEEDAPLPPPDDGSNSGPSTSESKMVT